MNTTTTALLNTTKMSSFSKPNIDSSSIASCQLTWVEQIQSFLDEDFDDDDLVPVCIFKVPKAITIYKPEAYSPQLIAFGPYHHWRDDLYEMETYKLLCAKRVQTQFQTTFKFQHLIKKLAKIEYRIRTCYQKYLSIDAETLAWMMAIDGLFLLEFLYVYVNKCYNNIIAYSARRSYITAGKKLAYDEILKDVFMLENQIPIFVLNKILRVQCSSGEVADNLLRPMLLGVCKELSPLKLMDDYKFCHILDHAHLVDLLYNLILPKAELLNLLKQQVDCRIKIEHEETEANEIRKDVTTLGKAWRLLSKVNLGVIKSLKKFLHSKPLTLMLKLSPMLEHFLPFDNEENSNDDNKDDDESKAPIVEQIMVPSVTELNDVGVTFIPTDGSISTIKFDARKRRFYLPKVHLDHNTEYVMRNLVAYEASAVSGPFVLGRYSELMNGIIDTAEDAKLLRERKIIINRMKSDQEVADFWNGMNTNVKLTNVSFIDKTIQEVNVYYNNKPKVKCYRMMKVYVYGSWRMLIFLATVLLLGLMILQSFCSVYSCPNIFKTLEDDDST